MTSMIALQNHSAEQSKQPSVFHVWAGTQRIAHDVIARHAKYKPGARKHVVQQHSTSSSGATTALKTVPAIDACPTCFAKQIAERPTEAVHNLLQLAVADEQGPGWPRGFEETHQHQPLQEQEHH